MSTWCFFFQCFSGLSARIRVEFRTGPARLGLAFAASSQPPAVQPLYRPTSPMCRWEIWKDNHLWEMLLWYPRLFFRIKTIPLDIYQPLQALAPSLWTRWTTTSASWGGFFYLTFLSFSLYTDTHWVLQAWFSNHVWICNHSPDWNMQRQIGSCWNERRQPTWDLWNQHRIPQ